MKFPTMIIEFRDQTSTNLHETLGTISKHSTHNSNVKISVEFQTLFSSLSSLLLRTKSGQPFMDSTKEVQWKRIKKLGTDL